ncbi:CGNR zinc finger domain-containing protein, partial [Streptomyces canus]|uniref:CGNR zinc finger domain-containing protein n=1 Tax=Streptomyces canus TaxID=58343 RepID=UPI0033B6B314
MGLPQGGGVGVAVGEMLQAEAVGGGGVFGAGGVLPPEAGASVDAREIQDAAQDAVDLLLSSEIRRVRVCGADECALRFVDRSPARNRRWCSMSRCGNRTKVRLHQARARRSEDTPADRARRELLAPPRSAHSAGLRRKAGPGMLSMSSGCTAWPWSQRIRA